MMSLCYLFQIKNEYCCLMADKEAADQIEEKFVKMGQKVIYIEYARRKDIKGSQPFISLLEPEEHKNENAPTSGKCLLMVKCI